MRCDGTTPLGNPYVMGSEADRDAVCDAFELLFSDEVVGPWGESAFPAANGSVSDLGGCDEIVSQLGKTVGFEGEVGGWDPVSARRKLDRLHAMTADGPIAICCHCAPLRCHLDIVARYLMSRHEDCATCVGTMVVA